MIDDVTRRGPVDDVILRDLIDDVMRWDTSAWNIYQNFCCFYARSLNNGTRIEKEEGEGERE